VSDSSPGQTRHIAQQASFKPRLALPVCEIVALYRTGLSENALAKCFGVSRRAIAARLTAAGVVRRTQSEAERIKWSQMTPTQRRRQIRAAHAAKRGRAVSLETKCKHAITVEKRLLNISPKEIELRHMLLRRGIEVVPQKAIGPYNCDLAAAPVAVEVYGGNWHWYGRHLARTEQRFRYLLDAGWFVYVMVVNQSFPLTGAGADHLVAYIQQVRRNKAARTEYRVVWGAGEFVVSGSADDEHITIIPPFACARDPATGRYRRVPRKAVRV